MSKLTMHRHGLPMAGLALAPRTTATERMRGGSWQRIRYRVLELACGLCAECQRQGRVSVAVEVDHVVPLAAGGSDDPVNLQALCVPCHQAKTARELACPRV